MSNPSYENPVVGDGNNFENPDNHRMVELRETKADGRSDRLGGTRRG